MVRYDGNDQTFAHFTIIDIPGTTQNVTYGLHFRIENSGIDSITIGYSNAETTKFGWTMPVTIIAQEFQGEVQL